MTSPLTPHWVAKIESQFENFTFARVDADTLDKLIKKEEEVPSKLSEKDEKALKEVLEGLVAKEQILCAVRINA